MTYGHGYAVPILVSDYLASIADILEILHLWIPAFAGMTAGLVRRS
jgi:hypothetical protein